MYLLIILCLFIIYVKYYIQDYIYIVSIIFLSCIFRIILIMFLIPHITYNLYYLQLLLTIII